MEPGKQCVSPYTCEFKDQCTAGKPADWIAHLPRLTAAHAGELKALGIEAISAIPVDFPLTSKQVIIRDATASGRPFVAPDLAHLEGITHGVAAAEAFLQLVAGYVSAPDEIDRRAALLAYCERDTIAMVEVHRALARLTIA